MLPALLLFMLPVFMLLVLPALLLFMLPVFVFMFVFVFALLAFPLALSAGVQAVQTLATARRVRSASVLRIECPPVPLGVRLFGSCAGLSLASKSRALSLQLGRLSLR